LIPAARAVPGDLVFFHDNVGDVYHVAIYLSPGLTVAAIDTDQGVNYQKIWDPTSATYGSFTHI
jgi:cell wall-associated NlpC family hydrolase